MGLNAALAMLRASPRNTVAIGDAENDHELLRLAEIGAAVEWGSRSLQAVADLVIAGSGAAAVADFITRVAASGRLPAPLKPGDVWSLDGPRRAGSFRWPSSVAISSLRAKLTPESLGSLDCSANG
jgi:hypothetical protein